MTLLDKSPYGFLEPISLFNYTLHASQCKSHLSTNAAYKTEPHLSAYSANSLIKLKVLFYYGLAIMKCHIYNPTALIA